MWVVVEWLRRQVMSVMIIRVIWFGLVYAESSRGEVSQWKENWLLR